MVSKFAKSKEDLGDLCFPFPFKFPFKFLFSWDPFLAASIASSVYATASEFPLAKILKASKIGLYPVQRLHEKAFAHLDGMRTSGAVFFQHFLRTVACNY